MKIVICGLGHVGAVTVAVLVRQGHTVVGVEANDGIRDLLSRGLAPFHEPQIANLMAAAQSSGRLSIAADLVEVADADMVIVCVGTPATLDDNLYMGDVKRVANDIGRVVRVRPRRLPPMLLVFRSTMLPGSMTEFVVPTIVAAAGEPPGGRYEVAYNPEFLREGSSIEDYFAPGRVVIGERQPGTARLLLELCKDIDAPKFMTSFEVAELTKFADNSFHALKVAFANEIGRFAVQSGIRPAEVFDLFCADTKLNISASYLHPGGPFGGACLSKDVRALGARMREAGIVAPIIDNIIKSNSLHSEFLLAEIRRRVGAGTRILLLGLSFKSGTSDVRESPLVNLAESLLDHGYDISIHDPDLLCFDATRVRGLSAIKFPDRLSTIVLERLPSSASWDLVVVGKPFPLIEEELADKAALFHINRL